MNEGVRRSAGLGPVLGAVGVAIAALVLSIGVLVWRSGAQRQVIDAQTARCRNADLAACDNLRSQCIKRSGESCTALAESILASAAPHDIREAVRLLAEACELRDRNACLRAASLLAKGDGVPADPGRATQLRARACTLGATDACTQR
jgi:hypothetical protein